MSRDLLHVRLVSFPLSEVEGRRTMPKRQLTDPVQDPRDGKKSRVDSNEEVDRSEEEKSAGADSHFEEIPPETEESDG